MHTKSILLAALVLISGLLMSAQAADPSLLAWYQLEDNADDSSDYGNHATARGGPQYIDGLSGYGRAMSFDGADDYLDTGRILLANVSEFTMAGWVSAGNSGSNRIGLFGQNDIIEMGFNGGNASIWTPAAGTTQTAWPFEDYTWHYIAVVADASSMKIYFDGELAVTGGGAADYGTGTFNFNIGGGGIWDDAGNWFLGNMDEVRVYDRALPEPEIAALAVHHEATAPIPADGSSVGAISDGSNVFLILDYTPSPEAIEHRGYFADNYDDVANRRSTAYLGTPTPWPTPDRAFVVGYDNDDYITNAFARQPLEIGKTYYWCVDEWDGVNTYGGDVWSFTVMPQEAWGPSPADGEKLVPSEPQTTLSWKLGDLDTQNHSLSFVLYWGTDQAALEAATTGGITIPGGTMIAGETKSTVVTGLPAETEIFWRIDTKRMLMQGSFPTYTTKGVVWGFTTGPKGSGFILREWWLGIPTGDLVSILTSHPRFPDDPNGSELLSMFEGPTNFMQDQTYGSRIHGWLNVIESGDYTFWIASDNQGELWLSTDEDPSNAVMVADTSGGNNWAPVRGWEDPDVHPSVPIRLEGGGMYYISALHKEGNGGDNLAVAWSGPDSGNELEVIPGRHLKSFVALWPHRPVPGDGQLHVPLSTTLSWTAGIDEDAGVPHATQRVYLGTDANAVRDADTTSFEYKGDPTGPNQYTPGPASLDYYQRYYWRIEGVEAGGKVRSGPVWSFKVTYNPALVVDPNLVGWWQFDDGSGAVAGDSSGYGNDGDLRGDPQWVAGYSNSALAFDGVDDYVEVPHSEALTVDNEVTVMAWINAERLSGPGGAAWQGILAKSNSPRSYSLYTTPAGPLHFSTAGQGSTSTLPVLTDEWVHVTAMVIGGMHRYYINGEFAGEGAADIVLPGDADDDPVVIGDSPEADREFLGLIDDVRIYNCALSEGEVVQIMRGNLAWAWNPNPANLATDVGMTPVLTWTPGDYAPAPPTNGHYVYFGADDPANMALVTNPPQPQSLNSYAPGELALDTTYYWAVDEANTASGVDAGRVWSFTTTNNLLIDDMETYTEWRIADNNIFEVWVDGMGNCKGSGNGTGANVFESPGDGVGGFQAMQFNYDNDGMVLNPCLEVPVEEPRSHYYSKAAAEVGNLPSGIGSNWTIGGVKALSLMFYGTTDNALESMWVKLTDTSNNSFKVLYGTGPGESLAHMEEMSWHEWDIALADFTGVDLASIKSMAIGVGDEGTAIPGGSGTLYFDEIRLYAPRCMPMKAKPAADFDDNCIVDYRDAAAMFDSWLAQYIPETAWGGVWQGTDIGAVDPAGSFFELPDGSLSITADGNDIWNLADAFYYVYQPLWGDGQLTVRVTDIGGPSTNDWRKAGVMIRETLDANSPHAFMAISAGGGGGEAFQWRPVRGEGSISSHTATGIEPPTCVRIVRSGDFFRGFYYSDGRWIQQGDAVTIPMSQNVYIGMAVTSHSNGELCTATFDRECSAEFLPADLFDDNVINFIDYAVLMTQWLDEVLWP